MLLYKVTKIKLERRIVDHKAKIYGPYKPTRTKVDYRTSQGAVTLAIKAADEGNRHADLQEQRDPNHERGWPARYAVEVAVCELPSFVEYGMVQGKSSKETEKNLAAWRSGSASP
jgi:hypothetical protein